MLGSWQLVSEEARNVFWHGVPGGWGEDRIKKVKGKRGLNGWGTVYVHTIHWYPKPRMDRSTHTQTFKVYKVYIVKRLGSEIRQSGFKSQLCYVLTGGPWANCFLSQGFSFFVWNTHTWGPWVLKERMGIQSLTDCLVHNNSSINNSCYYGTIAWRHGTLIVPGLEMWRGKSQAGERRN